MCVCDLICFSSLDIVLAILILNRLCFRYELKDSQFHYEAQKNNELLRSQDRWNELMEEREMLTRKSQEFQKSLQQRSAVFA